MTSPSLMHETGHSKLEHWDSPEGWDGREVGGGFGMETHVHPWLTHVGVRQDPPQYCKRTTEVGRHKKGLFLKPLEKASSCQQLDFELLASKNMIIHFCCFKSSVLWLFVITALEN